MGKGRSGGGGGTRDNRKWGKDTDGYTGHTDPDEIQESIGNESWENRLTDDQKDAIGRYANSDHADEAINNHYRNGAPIGEDMQKTADDLEKALDDSYLKGNTQLLRRADASLLGGASTPDQIRDMYGQVVTDKGFMSTSVKVDTGAYAGTRPIDYHIRVNGRQSGVGAYIQRFSDFEENEFLFNRGSSFRILGAYESGGKTHVNLEYVGRMR